MQPKTAFFAEYTKLFNYKTKEWIYEHEKYIEKLEYLEM